MPAAETLLPEDIAVEPLQAIYDEAGLQTEVDAEGDLIVSRGIPCYVIPTQRHDRILLLAFVGTQDEADRASKFEFANRVNNQISTVRARVNEKDRVIFDYYIPVEGGITAQAVLLATQLFLQATAHAIRECDEDKILR